MSLEVLSNNLIQNILLFIAPGENAILKYVSKRFLICNLFDKNLQYYNKIITNYNCSLENYINNEKMRKWFISYFNINNLNYYKISQEDNVNCIKYMNNNLKIYWNKDIINLSFKYNNIKCIYYILDYSLETTYLFDNKKYNEVNLRNKSLIGRDNILKHFLSLSAKYDNIIIYKYIIDKYYNYELNNIINLNQNSYFFWIKDNIKINIRNNHINILRYWDSKIDIRLEDKQSFYYTGISHNNINVLKYYNNENISIRKCHLFHCLQFNKLKLFDYLNKNKFNSKFNLNNDQLAYICNNKNCINILSHLLNNKLINKENIKNYAIDNYKIDILNWLN